MSKSQSRIHPLSSQSADNNIAPPPARPAAATCCCLLTYLVAIMITTAFILYVSSGISTLKETVYFDVVNASLTQFDLTNNNNTLDYNLTVDLNVTNPNGNYVKKIDYDEIEAGAYYEGSVLESMNLMPFHQDTKNRSTNLHIVFQGQSLVPSLGEYSNKLSSGGFYRDKSHGSFDIKVKFSLNITYHNYFLHPILRSSLDQGKYRIFCDLRRVPMFNLSSSSMNGSSDISTTMVGGGFQTTNCKVTGDLDEE